MNEIINKMMSKMNGISEVEGIDSNKVITINIDTEDSVISDSEVELAKELLDIHKSGDYSKILNLVNGEDSVSFDCIGQVAIKMLLNRNSEEVKSIVNSIM